MFCSRCGALVRNDSTICPECGQIFPPPDEAAHAAEVFRYATTIRKLGLWFVLFAAFNAALGAVALIHGLVASGSLLGSFEPWPHPPLMNWTYAWMLAWVLLILRVLLAFLGGAALRVQAPWGRRIATVAAGVALTQFPIGLLFGAYALVRLMGGRNSALYEEITGGTQERRKLQAR